MSYRDLLLAPSPLITNIAPGKEPLVKVFGVPFDATSTYRAGSRFGPDALRNAFLNIEVYSRRFDIDLESLSLDDLGNLRQTSDPKVMVRSVEGVTGEIMREGSVPAILGGEHTLTYGAYRAMPKRSGLIVFDAHLDLREEFADMKLSHATYLRRLVEEKGVEDVVIVGSRAGCKEEWDYVRTRGMSVIPTPYGTATQGMIKSLKRQTERFDHIYVSFDMDVLDPAYAPGVGNPEPGGLSTREVLELLYALKGVRVVGFDVVELDPLSDTGASVAAAAKILAELCCLVAAQR